MTTIQMQYFIEVAKCESFSKAAENLYVSHQTLSNQLKALEKELGIELINRSNKRRIVLTEAGKIMFDAFSESRELFEKAYMQAKKLHEVQKHSFIIGIQDMRLVRSYVVPLIKKMQDSSEIINLEYRLGEPMEMVHMLEQETVDMLIMIASDLHKDFPYHKAILHEDALHLVAAVSKQHPLAKKKAITIENLEDETILMIGESYSKEAYENFQNDLIVHSFTPKKVKYFNGPRAINIAVETNAGVGLLFDELLEEARDEICTFPFYLANATKTDMVLVWKNPKFAKTAERIIRMK